jgi:hypothetical protein
MTYISKGVIQKESGCKQITINRCGRDYILQGSNAKLWLAGRFGMAVLADKRRSTNLQYLDSLGLVDVTDTTAAIARYRLLINCVICQADSKAHRFPLGRKERQVWKWITSAGFKLRISELVFLLEQNIKPVPELLGKTNWHTLVDTLYTKETIFDGILDTDMEQSPARDTAVNAVLGLLRKRRIILI